MRPGTPERRTHDYHPHGTSKLFARLMGETRLVFGERHHVPNMAIEPFRGKGTRQRFSLLEMNSE